MLQGQLLILAGEMLGLRQLTKILNEPSLCPNWCRKCVLLVLNICIAQSKEADLSMRWLKICCLGCSHVTSCLGPSFNVLFTNSLLTYEHRYAPPCQQAG